MYKLDGDGGRLLIGLTRSSPREVGMSVPIMWEGNEVVLERLLGAGGSSVVYSGKRNSEEIVIKQYKKNCLDLLSVEKKNLEQVDSHGEMVTHCVGQSDDNTCLLVKPVGIHWAKT